MLKQEELKWIQRAKDKNIKEAETNTIYFDAKANERHRLNDIVSLENDGIVIIRQKNLEKFITDFYKNLFGQPDSSSIYLNDTCIPNSNHEIAYQMTEPFSMYVFKKSGI